ncbi:dTMP kinase [Candidatus Peribacteria bacterium RIFCSPHIGHO2_02_FULL_49_16]|nr:MAG: dTMP kinase [Candidatus Peribacteria bacterium RIFCSPHIGHO2_01_FULL_49_38]OGJ59207.1 MAG: dTMP kinase [Candidatus Peribacteria bacterium RIFCSPHIGHO2_02_FULL_49_16]
MYENEEHRENLFIIAKYDFLYYPYPMQGTFMVFEGPDGSGKSFQSKILAEKLRKEGFDVLHTSEPTNGPIGKLIRSCIAGDGGTSHEVIQLLFSADRGWHLEKEIEPALNAGKIVVSDRYYYSTFAYGEAAGLKNDWLKMLNMNFREPDCVVLTLPPLEQCLLRIGVRDTQEMFEKRTFQEVCYRLYERLSCEKNVITIDTSKEKEKVAQEIWEKVTRSLLVTH